MRTKIVAGNWKMNLTKSESENLVRELSTHLGSADLKGNRVMVFPPFVNIQAAQETAGRDARIEVGAQNMHQADSGAYTGEVSGPMLRNAGVNSVILGHSERREYFNESDELLKEKVDAALRHDLEVVFCFGEKLEQRHDGNHFAIVGKQLKQALFHLEASAWKKVVLAYEPVWAIGTGMTASPDQAQEMHAFIRKTIAEAYSQELADAVSILYGGSVKPNNASEIFGKPDVDGGLIGGASLKAADFFAIIQAM